jgi:hypothetical protein
MHAAPFHIAARFELTFISLSNNGRCFSFPCDESGRVDIDALSERARNNYFYARGTVGREFAWPFVQAAQ